MAHQALGKPSANFPLIASILKPMNLSQLRYRIGIGGLPWVAKTALGVARHAMEPAKAAKPAFELGSSDPAAPRILHLHSGWAIETVGRLWFTGQTRARVTFMRTGDPQLTAEFINGFDFVWYGYSSLFRQHPCDPAKAILAVHDPAELFPERADWKSACAIPEEHLRRLRGARAVVVISREMQQVLESAGVNALRIPTCSQVPLRNEAEISPTDQASLLSVGRIYRRKNFEQFKRIAASARRHYALRSQLKGDHFPLSEEQYLEMLDRHSIYVCTSFQEGGPLPVMDAMRRGAVVISNCVGQIPEIIEHGVNGFICGSDKEFQSVIVELAMNPDELFRLRLASLKRIQVSRNPQIIREAVNEAITDILAAS
jgi:glycosyltransferase involved in cell wall biosynthesis